VWLLHVYTSTLSNRLHCLPSTSVSPKVVVFNFRLSGKNFLTHQFENKTKSAYKICEFIIYVENVLHVSATFCGNLQGCVARRYVTKNNHCISMWWYRYKLRARARTHTRHCIRKISVAGRLLAAGPSRVTLTPLCNSHLLSQLLSRCL